MEKVRSSVEQEKYIRGNLLYMIYTDEAEHFSIAKIRIDETTEDFAEKEIVIKGYFSKLQENIIYYFYGELERHAKYGMQYRVEKYHQHIPDTAAGLIGYLSSDLFPGIGKRTAEKIVQTLGEGAITKIMENPDCLQKVPGLKKGTGEKLIAKLRENQGFDQVVLYLGKYHIGLKMAQKIYQEYKMEALEKLEKDPYEIVFEVEGFGFQTADEIAVKNGLPFDHPTRIGAGCIFVLQQAVQHGHVFLPILECLQEMGNLLQIGEEKKLIDILEQLDKEKKVIVREGKVYLPSLYYAEDGFSSHVKRLMQHPLEVEIPLAELMKMIGEIEEQEVISYGREQFEAIQKAIHSKMMILTGGPGTGKTTVIKGILQVYRKVHQIELEEGKQSKNPFLLAAPTGRAAKRLAESTGLPAMTIHRLLGWNGTDSFDKNEHEPLKGKLLIVDEFSMVDIWLANHLFKAIPNDMQVLLVGDEDQLPSVGPGQVLADLLSSQSIPSVKLNEVYRQKEGSKIIQIAHEIKNGKCNESSLERDQGFSFIPCRQEQLIDCILQVFQKAMKKGIDVKREIQVLAPMYKTQAGIHEINRHLQQLINPKMNKKREVKLNDIVYRVGDKVLQLVNQPEDGIYNGDIGEIVAVFKENENVEKREQIVVRFDEREVVYDRKDYKNLMHAYCISIHKSQGSEFPIVILPILHSYYHMLRKNLLYTAITRSKESLIICGEKSAFFKGIEREDTNKRYTTLEEQLKEKLGDILPISGKREEDLSPYDFL